LLVHNHELDVTVSTVELQNPEYRTFRMFRKLLGKMVNYNDAITNVYNNGIYVSPALQLDAESYGHFYFNVEVEGADAISAFFRVGATSAAVTTGIPLSADHTTNKFSAASHGYSNGDRIQITASTLPSGILNTILYYVVQVSGIEFKVSLTNGGSPVDFASNGTTVVSKKWSDEIATSGDPMVSTPSVFIQYLFVFTAANTTESIPTLFYADGHVAKFSYRKGGLIAEAAVEFKYETGWMNNDEPMVDKIYKRIATEHIATGGSLSITWETENATGTWAIDLSRYPKRWHSFFHDNAMGSSLGMKFYKSDLEDLTLKEFKGFYTTQPMLI
jgi:hypothetical protein